MIAICSLAGAYIKWPDTEEQQKTSLYLQDHYQFPHCVGISNSTLILLAFEPHCQDAPNYSGHKSGYSLSSMIICDHKKCIRH